MVVGGLRIASDRRTDEPFGLSIVAVLLRDDAEEMKRFRVIRFDAQNFAITHLSLGKMAGLVVRESSRKNLADLTGVLWRSFGSESQHRIVRALKRSKRCAKWKGASRLATNALLSVC